MTAPEIITAVVTRTTPRFSATLVEGPGGSVTLPIDSADVDHDGTPLDEVLDELAAGETAYGMAVIRSAAVDGSSDAISIAGWDTDEAEWVDGAGPFTRSQFASLMTSIVGAATVPMLVADGAHAGIYRVSASTLGAPWTAVDGPTRFVSKASGTQPAEVVFLPAPHLAWVPVSPDFAALAAIDAYDDAVGLFAGITTKSGAITQTEGILDRWLFGTSAYIDADAQALNLATLTTTGGTPTPTYGVAPPGTGITRVLVLGRVDPAEDGVYALNAGVWTKGEPPDVHVGNGARFTVKPWDGNAAMTWMVTVDDPGFVQRGGNYGYAPGILDPSEDDAPSTWSLVTPDPTAPGGSGPDLSDADPEDLGTADSGASDEASRADHVHPMPSAADVGAATAGHDHSGTYQPLDSDLTALAALTNPATRIPTTIRLASDVDVTSSTTPVNTGALAVPVTNGQTVTFRAVLRVTGSSTGDLRVAVTAPAGTLDVVIVGPSSAVTSVPGNMGCHAPITASGGQVDTLGCIGGSTVTHVIEGTFVASASGTVQIQHAQRVSDLTATSVKAGSTLTYWTA